MGQRDDGRRTTDNGLRGVGDERCIPVADVESHPRPKPEYGESQYAKGMPVRLLRPAFSYRRSTAYQAIP